MKGNKGLVSFLFFMHFCLSFVLSWESDRKCEEQDKGITYKKHWQLASNQGKCGSDCTCLVPSSHYKALNFLVLFVWRHFTICPFSSIKCMTSFMSYFSTAVPLALWLDSHCVNICQVGQCYVILKPLPHGGPACVWMIHFSKLSYVWCTKMLRRLPSNMVSCVYWTREWQQKGWFSNIYNKQQHFVSSFHHFSCMWREPVFKSLDYEWVSSKVHVLLPWKSQQLLSKETLSDKTQRLNCKQNKQGDIHFNWETDAAEAF